MMVMGKILWEGWIHLFIPYTLAEYMSYAYVPGTTLGSKATENKNTVISLRDLTDQVKIQTEHLVINTRCDKC